MTFITKLFCCCISSDDDIEGYSPMFDQSRNIISRKTITYDNRSVNGIFLNFVDNKKILVQLSTNCYQQVYLFDTDISLIEPTKLMSIQNELNGCKVEIQYLGLSTNYYSNYNTKICKIKIHHPIKGSVDLSMFLQSMI